MISSKSVDSIYFVRVDGRTRSTQIEVRTLFFNGISVLSLSSIGTYASPTHYLFFATSFRQSHFVNFNPNCNVNAVSGLPAELKKKNHLSYFYSTFAFTGAVNMSEERLLSPTPWKNKTCRQMPKIASI
ncbi:hypothetical protein L6452_42663 [Arctium lappa]|uniref:Uncharacterized protein n=1 Tax=Arctium lappa TaxID=4217 RepID=A0ACB8XJH1_ARCLA|nr:hypothetical protein L6452_42663 [Arctium lappa]